MGDFEFGRQHEDQTVSRPFEPHVASFGPVPLVVHEPTALTPARPAPTPAHFKPQQAQHRQAAQSVFSALSTRDTLLAESSADRIALQRQIGEAQAHLPEGAEQAAFHRAQLRDTAPTIPAYYATPPHERRGQSPDFGDVAGLYRSQLGPVLQTENGRGVKAEPLASLQRAVVGQFAQAYRANPASPLQRAKELGQTLASLQRLPFGQQVSAVLLGSAGGLPKSDVPVIQRALLEADADLALQERQDQQVQHLHALQRQLAEQDAQSDHQHVMRRVQARQGGGEPIPAAIQRHLEAGLNADLSRVRVHTDGEADQLARGVQARAFTTGQDIYFRHGQYQPNTQSGLELLGHEVTHTVQQAQGRVGSGMDPDAGLEQQAQQSGGRLARAAPLGTTIQPVRTVSASLPGQSFSLQRQTAPAAPQVAPGKDPKVLAQHLAQLLTGTRQPVASEGLASRVDAATHNRHLDHLQSAFGRQVTANLLAGSTRQLASIPPSFPDRLPVYTLPVLDQGAVAQIAHELNSLKAQGLLQPTLAAFEAQTGKSLYAVLGERVRDPKLRASVLKGLPAPLSEAQLTRDAFLENLTVNFVYSNASAQQMNTQDKPEERRGANPSQLLAAFGYTAGEPLSGRWGLQMRVFTPIPGKAKDQSVIVAFRGTEGIALDPRSNPEGAQDTMIGDFAQAQPGYNQFGANAAWIDQVIRQAARGGRVTMIGHSLGGALAQIAAARYPQLTAGVVVFQAANISQQDVARVEAYNRAHPKQAVRSRSYRVDGDVVPTSGEATLPGEIYYFDRVARSLKDPNAPGPWQSAWQQYRQEGLWNMTKDAGLSAGFGALLSDVPYLNAAAATKGHVVPMLSTYLRGQPGGPRDPQRQALLQYGQRDENELPHQVDDGKGGLKTQRPTEAVQTVFSGDYPTSRDPRLRAESVRANAVPSAMDLSQSYAGVFRDNIAYDTVLGHLYALAQKAKDFQSFQQQAAQVTGKPQIDLLPEDVALARQLHLDKSPQVNAKAALKNLVDFERQDLNEMTSGLSDRWPVRARTRANNYLFSKFDTQMAKYSQTPVLNEYRQGGHGGYQVQIPERLRNSFDNPIVLRAVWQLYHPITSVGRSR